MIDRSLGEFIRNRCISGVYIHGKHDDEGHASKEEENSGASALDEKKLGGVRAAVVRNLAAGGVPDGEKLGGDGRGARHAAVVAPQLHEDEDQQAGEGSDGGDVDEVLNVAVPRVLDVPVSVAGGRGRRREGGIRHERRRQRGVHGDDEKRGFSASESGIERSEFDRD